MGRGDRRTKRGKIWRGSTGKTRLKGPSIGRAKAVAKKAVAVKKTPAKKK